MSMTKSTKKEKHGRRDRVAAEWSDENDTGGRRGSPVPSQVLTSVKASTVNGHSNSYSYGDVLLKKSASFPAKIGKRDSHGISTDFTNFSSSPFDTLVRALYTDQRLKWEIAYGKRMGFYLLKGDIGTGNFSKVKVAMHALTKERVAVKILDKTKMDARTKKLLSGEITSMEKLHHPNIIRLFEVMHSKSKLFLVMEYACGGELFSRLTSQGKMAENEAKIVFSQILSAIDHMHRHKIIHRDLKAENVFFAEKRVVKVGDFGFSTKAHGSIDQLDTFCGSPPYAAPELFRDSYYYGEYVDIWALGILLYFTVTGTMPFRAETVGKLKRKILLGNFTVPSHVSSDCKHLIQSILRLEPKQRLSVTDIAQSSWFTGVSLPKKNSFLALNPADIVRSEAHPEEAYALYMLDRLGINDEHISQLPTDGTPSAKTGFTLANDFDRERRNTDISDFQVSFDHNNAIIGTYRILLNRAYLKLKESCKEDRMKFSAITNHITGKDDNTIDRTVRLCEHCESDPSVSLEVTDADCGKSCDASSSSAFESIPSRKKDKPVGNVKSKFCTIL